MVGWQKSLGIVLPSIVCSLAIRQGGGIEVVTIMVACMSSISLRISFIISMKRVMFIKLMSSLLLFALAEFCWLVVEVFMSM